MLFNKISTATGFSADVLQCLFSAVLVVLAVVLVVEGVKALTNKKPAQAKK